MCFAVGGVYQCSQRVNFMQETRETADIYIQIVKETVNRKHRKASH